MGTVLHAGENRGPAGGPGSFTGESLVPESSCFFSGSDPCAASARSGICCTSCQELLRLSCFSGVSIVAIAPCIRG